MYPDSRREVRFDDLIREGLLEISDGYRAKHSELGAGGPIFLRAAHLQDSGFDFSGAEYFRAELQSRVTSKLAQAGDTVITTKGNSTGRAGFVTGGMPEFVYSPHLSFWRSLNRGKLVPGFLRYWARGPQFRHQLSGLKESTDMAPYLSLRDQRQLRISLPSANEQQAIADLLGALDDKIELNREMNRTLEAMARALFRSWFMDFDPVVAKADGREPFGMDANTAALFPDRFVESELGPIPEGWSVRRLDQIGYTLKSLIQPLEVPPETPFIGLEHMPKKSVVLAEWTHARGLQSTKLIFCEGDILFGKLRPYFHKVGVALIDGICSTDILVVRPRASRLFGLILGHLSSPELIAFADGSSEGTRQPRTSWESLGRYQICAPTDKVAEPFTRIATDIVEKFKSNVLVTVSLTDLRDLLLPKLLSGEIRLQQAEALAAAVL